MAMFIDEMGELMFMGGRAPGKQEKQLTLPVTEPVRLMATLEQYGKNKNIFDHVRGALSTLYRIAEAGNFPFHPAEMIRDDDVARAITNLLGRQVLTVIPVSISHPLPLGLLSGEERYQERLLLELDHGSVMYSKTELLNMRLYHTYKYGFASELARVINAAIWTGLSEAIKTGTRPITIALGHVLTWPAIKKCLEFFLCHALFGSPADTEEMQRLELLLKLTASGILLLGERSLEPGRWIVLVG